MDRRLLKLVEDLAAQPTASVSQASGSWAATKGACRFWDSSRVKPQAIRAAHTQGTIERTGEHPMVLVIQDTTDLDFTGHPSVEGVGPLSNVFQRGLRVHSALAVSIPGVPLGLVHQEVWARDPETVGKRHTRRKRETKDKESQRWLTGLKASQEAIPQGVGVVTVADQEADIYDLFIEERREGSELLIRAAHNRRVEHEPAYLFEAVEQSPVLGRLRVELRRKDERPGREAVLKVRHLSLAITPPHHQKRRASLKPVEVQVILAEEEDPPEGVEGIRWLLVTTLKVESFEDAARYVGWYALRWLVERYHYVLKSGCRLEELQLEKAERIERALATYSLVAWRLLWLTYEARQEAGRSCEGALLKHEWQALYCTIHKTPLPPQEAPTLREAVRWIAQLGGFLGRKGDGEPGVKVVWRGLCRLNDIAATWQLLHTPSQLDIPVMGNA